MRVLAAILVIANLGSAAMPGGRAEATSDLEEYLRQIRNWGMSESAHSALFTVACIVNGSTILSVSRDSTSGWWLRGYRATACPLPGADSLAVAKWQEEIRQRSEPVIALLRPSADSDGSGFVTSQEAGAFRELVEFGYVVDYLVRGETLDPEAVAEANSMTLQKLMDRAEAYNEVARRFNAASTLRMPVLELASREAQR